MPVGGILWRTAVDKPMSDPESESQRGNDANTGDHIFHTKLSVEPLKSFFRRATAELLSTHLGRGAAVISFAA